MKAFKIYFFVVFVPTAILAGCKIDLEQRSGDFPPFILDSFGYIKYPVGSKTLTFGNDELLSLFCHGTDKKPNYIMDANLKNPTRLYLACKNSQFFNGDLLLSTRTISEISCKQIQEPEIIRETESDCSKGFSADGRMNGKEKITLVKVGWRFDEKYFEQWRACIDENFFATFWTKHVVYGQSIKFRDTNGHNRPKFRVDSRGYNFGRGQRFFKLFNGKTVDNAYKKTKQTKAIKELLGTNNMLPDGTQIIDTQKGSNFLARGHLSPHAAFIEGPEQDATYYFFNVAPQFQSFNNRNWKQLETFTREMAEMHNGSVTVYSGTYGILEYPNYKNENTSIFILENDGKWYIPVPKYYWKIILNEVTKEVTAFVGLNNPHADDIPLEEAFCTTSCSNIAGVDWSVEDEARGRMSCCTISDLKNKIGFIPDIPDIYSNLI